MKAITLQQPWATLVAIGLKRIETRSWCTSHRGLLAIHAAADFPRANRLLSETPAFRVALRSVARPLPTGAVLAICELKGVCRTEDMVAQEEFAFLDARHELLAQMHFGDYSPGRFAWALGEIAPLAVPVPAKGKLGLWEWDRGQFTYAEPNNP